MHLEFIAEFPYIAAGEGIFRARPQETRAPEGPRPRCEGRGQPRGD